MATQNSSGFKTFTATAVAITEGLRLKVDSAGLVSAAAASELGIGVAIEACAASGSVTVKLWSAPGTFLFSAAGPVTCGASLYGAAAGQVDDTGTYKTGYVALEAATTQGDLIECAEVDVAATSVGTFVSGDIGTAVAAGTDLATAVAVTKPVTYVTAADDTTGCRLPAATAGKVMVVINTVANKHLHIYPTSGEYINAVQDTGISLAAAQMAYFVCAEAGKWGCTFITA